MMSKKNANLTSGAHEVGEILKRGKSGPSTIPSLPNGPEVLFFSPKVEDATNLGHAWGKRKSAVTIFPIGWMTTMERLGRVVVWKKRKPLSRKGRGAAKLEG
jgi:hypothetical protein